MVMDSRTDRKEADGTTLSLSEGCDRMKRTRDVRHVDRELLHYRMGWLVTIGFVLIAVGMLLRLAV
jgi:hypothetical protein